MICKQLESDWSSVFLLDFDWSAALLSPPLCSRDVRLSRTCLRLRNISRKPGWLSTQTVISSRMLTFRRTSCQQKTTKWRHWQAHRRHYIKSRYLRSSLQAVEEDVSHRFGVVTQTSEDGHGHECWDALEEEKCEGRKSRVVMVETILSNHRHHVTSRPKHTFIQIQLCTVCKLLQDASLHTLQTAEHTNNVRRATVAPLSAEAVAVGWEQKKQDEWEESIRSQTLLVGWNVGDRIRPLQEYCVHVVRQTVW